MSASNLSNTSVTIKIKEMASKFVAPKRKEEYVSAIHTRTDLAVQELRKHDVDRLKVIWNMVKPRKPQSPLPVAWKKLDVAALKEIYEKEVCPDLGRANDRHWSRWNRPQLVSEIEMWHTEVMESQEPEDLFQDAPMCPACRIPLVVRTNRLTKEDFFGCIRFPLCSQTLPLKYAGHPTKVVQDNLHYRTQNDETKKDRRTVEKGRGAVQKNLAGGRQAPGDWGEQRGESSDGSWVKTGPQPIEETSENAEGKSLYNTNVTEEELKILQELRQAKSSVEK